MMRFGIDVNASTIRAVQGQAGDYPLPLLLDAPAHELPLVINLEKSTAEIGRAGLGAVREKPHLVCQDFLPHIGDTSPRGRRWLVNRHRLDADAAMLLTWQKLLPFVRSGKDIQVALPGYLEPTQVNMVRRLAEKAKLPRIGTLSSPLAAALVAYAEQAWVTSAVILDIDNFALTLAHVQAVEGLAQVQERRTLPNLGLRAWKDRLINAMADVCVLQTRRDPRDTPGAEQRLFDQLDGLLDATLHGRVMQIGIQANHWYQNLLVTPEQTNHFCLSLLRSVQGEIERFLHGLRHEEAAPVFILTHSAGRLPGLVAMLRQLHEAGIQTEVGVKVKPKTVLEDFGDDLMDASGQALAGTAILSPDALARAAHCHDEPGGHCEDEAILPLPLPVDAGPARIHFQGQNFYLAGGHFSLGVHAGCQLVFDPQKYPEVAGKHCDIAFEQRTFVLNNRSREGTLVNESPVQHSIVLQAGDWIRLGSQGPVLRFLGQQPLRGKATTA